MDWATDARQYAPAAERNTGPILAVLGPHLPRSGTILEIGSGIGQHAVALAAAHPELTWQPSDANSAARASIAAWTTAADLANVRAPLEIHVTAYVYGLFRHGGRTRAGSTGTTAPLAQRRCSSTARERPACRSISRRRRTSFTPRRRGSP
jgi:Protein of unknown function (DUF938)